MFAIAALLSPWAARYERAREERRGTGGLRKKNASICVIRGKRKGECGRFTPRRFADKMNFYACDWGFDMRGSWLSTLFCYTLRDIKHVSQRKSIGGRQ